MRCKNIEFKSQNATLRGRLYLPQDQRTNIAIVVMAHGFSASIDGMTADKYAEAFQEAGYGVLLYDHRNLGLSDGEPRREINYWVQTRGYIDCIDFIYTLPEIDKTRVAVWGCSSSGREAFMVGAMDDRVKLILTQVPAFGDTSPVDDIDGQLFAKAKEIVMSQRISELPHTVSGPIPVVSSDPENTPCAVPPSTALRWFSEYGGRSDSNWQNIITIVRPILPETFHAGQCATHLQAPILMVVARHDEVSGASTNIAHEVFSRISQPKELVEIDGGHFGLLYYPSEDFEKSSDAQIKFLNKYFY
jgi:cephalosporin-C deacetylase-like acetyl esterase